MLYLTRAKTYIRADRAGWQKRVVWKKVLFITSTSIIALTLGTARFTLARLHAQGDINDPFVNAQVEDMKADIHKARDIGESRFGILVAPPEVGKLTRWYQLERVIHGSKQLSSIEPWVCGS